MIKLLIVDDEYLALDFIKFLVEKNFDDIEIVGTARSGREGIEKAIELKPDVIFMDIRMPGINGIEAITKIQERVDDIYFVITTAYEYFDYAKDAVKLGVYEYLLKPINKEKMIDVLKAIKNEIKDKREALQREMILKEKVNKVLPIIEGQFIYSKMINSKTKGISFYQDMFAMDLNYGYTIMGVVKHKKEDSTEEEINDSLLDQEFFEIFTHEIKKLTPCLVGLPLVDRVVAYIPVKEIHDMYEIRNRSIDIARKLYKRIDDKIRIDYRIGIGRPYTIENFSSGCNEAYMAANLPNLHKVTHFEDVAITTEKVDDYPKVKESILINKTLMGDKEGALRAFEDLFLYFTVNFSDDIDKIKSYLIEILILMKRNIPYDIFQKDLYEHKYLRKLLKITNLDVLKMTFSDHLKSIIKGINEEREEELHGIIAKVLDYMERNYNKNISLNDLAEEFNMSYHYFSKFFKESTGKKFVDYLTEIRIEKSKELLKQGNLSVKEVCYEIGYRDPNYFSKAFRKATGVTPTEFRKK
ncbi:response regulator [Oceanirhabdus sp. W0125-5]|uniref:response regulator n=1 Tax=Oceanirhabdus sp. W0125-5 TaxID=2999116 RepID=UPI0022F322DA|nr:helix-turn-helix domain-containing protein [Oceanirhabdus sp. W0125-5]WBW98227.1 response regulator [Oceanirhabdus sp. W0125-5]